MNLLQDSNGVYSARSFVNWYNGMPGYEEVNNNNYFIYYYAL